jgi:hypothetical protein
MTNSQWLACLAFGALAMLGWVVFDLMTPRQRDDE